MSSAQMPDPTPAAGAVVDRAAILAEMATLKVDGDSTPAPSTKKAPAAKAAPVEAPTAESEAGASEDNPTPTDAPAEDLKAAPVEGDEPDPETKKRLDMVAKAEKRARQQTQQERREFEAERQAFIDEQKAFKAQMAEFAKFKTTRKRDVVGLLKELGYSETDFNVLSQSIYAHSPEAQADPKQAAARKAYVEQSMKERELRDEVAELRSWKEQFEQSQTKAQQQAELQREADQYMASVTKAVTDTAPVVKKMLEKTPAKANAGLAASAQALIAESGEVPTPAEVIAHYEKARRAELAELDINVDEWLGKKKPAPAPPAKPARTLGGLNGATRASKSSPISDPRNLDDDARAQLLNEMSQLPAD